MNNAKLSILLGYPIATLLGYFLILYAKSFAPIFIPLVGNFMMIYGFGALSIGTIRPIAYISRLMSLSQWLGMVAYVLFAFFIIASDSYYINDLPPDSLRPFVALCGKEAAVLAYGFAFVSVFLQSISFGYITTICGDYSYLKVRAFNFSGMTFVKSMIFLFLLFHGLGICGDTRYSRIVLMSVLFFIDLSALFSLRRLLFSPLLERVSEQDQGDSYPVGIPAKLVSGYLMLAAVMFAFAVIYRFLS